MNIYHQYINLPFNLTKPEIAKSGYPDYPKHAVLTDYEDPNIEPFLDSLGLKCNHTEVFYTPPNGGKIPLHTDLPALDNRVKINLTWGPENGTMRWWVARDEASIIDGSKMTEEQATAAYGDFSAEAHQNLIAQEEDCDMVYEAITNTPSLVNVGQLHSTYNPGDYGRWTLCFHLAVGEDFLDWDTAQVVLKDYLVPQ